MNSDELDTLSPKTEKQTTGSLKKAKKPLSDIKNPPPRVTKKTVILLAVGVILLSAMIFGIYKLFFTQEERVAVTGMTSYGLLNKAIEGSGTTTPADSVTYEVNGKVLEWKAAPGDQVEPGDLLYVLDSSDAEDDILESEVELEKLYEQLSEIQESIAGQRVTAEFSGRIEQIQAEEGKNVQNGTVLARLIDDSHMKATLYFGYIYENDLYVGKKLTVSLPEQMLTAEGTISDIQYVDYVTPEGMKCFAVTVCIPNPGALTEGMTVSCWAEADDGTCIYATDDAVLEYDHAKNVTAGANGELADIYAVNYQRVSAGDILFYIDASGYESQLETVQKQIQNYEEKIADLQEAIATEYTRYSDISGQVVSAEYAENRMTGTDMGTVVIYNQDSMEIAVNIDELDADQLYEGMDVYVYRTTSSQKVSYPATLTYLSLEATAGSSGVSTFAATITIDSQGDLSSGVTVYYSISPDGGGEAEETVLAPLNALCTYDDGYYLLVQAEKQPENTIDPEAVGGSVTDYPGGYYAVPVEVGDYNASYIQILSGVERDTDLFLRYQNVAPSGGDTTSDVKNEERQDMMPGGMGDFGSGQMPGFGGGMQQGGQSGEAGGFRRSDRTQQGGMTGSRG